MLVNRIKFGVLGRERVTFFLLGHESWAMNLESLKPSTIDHEQSINSYSNQSVICEKFQESVSESTKTEWLVNVVFD